MVGHLMPHASRLRARRSGTTGQWTPCRESTLLRLHTDVHGHRLRPFVAGLGLFRSHTHTGWPAGAKGGQGTTFVATVDPPNVPAAQQQSDTTTGKPSNLAISPDNMAHQQRLSLRHYSSNPPPILLLHQQDTITMLATELPAPPS